MAISLKRKAAEVASDVALEDAPLDTSKPTQAEVLAYLRSQVRWEGDFRHQAQGRSELWFGTRRGTEYRLALYEIQKTTDEHRKPCLEIEVGLTPYDAATREGVHAHESFVYAEDCHDYASAVALGTRFLGDAEVDAVTPELFRQILDSRCLRRVGLGRTDWVWMQQQLIPGRVDEYYASLHEPYTRYLPNESCRKGSIESAYAVDAKELWAAMPEADRLAGTEAENYRLYVLRLCHLVDWLSLVPETCDETCLSRSAELYDAALSRHPELSRYLLSRCLKALQSMEGRREGPRKGLHLYEDLRELLDDMYDEPSCL
jgi:hypothetical protein